MSANGESTLRLFFALWPDDATRARLQRLQAAMRGRVVPYENLHLTLAFLGQQPARLLPMLQDMLACAPVAAIPMELNKIGYFPRKRIAWAGMHAPPDALEALQRALTACLREEKTGFDDRSRFLPHVTLARDAALPPDMVFDPIVWHATDVALVQSITQAGGPIYRVLARRSLEEPEWTASETAGNADGMT
jgi:2'-5' RNA ligase